MDNAKYDRQIRLWQTSGQHNLERAHVCLVNATTTGVEALKNLVLPGIGAFTIVAPGLVDLLEGNFFLDEDNVGQPVAEALTAKLRELNPDVRGTAVSTLDQPDDFWDQFTAVIVSDFELKTLREVLWSKSIPLIVVNTVGFYGSVKVNVPETTVVETHDPSKLYDLRIDKPWPELQHYVDLVDLDALDDVDHAHVPYVVIFIKALTQWNNAHGQPPQNYNEKKQFRAYIESLARNIKLEANFLEASHTVHRALQVSQVPAAVAGLFSHPSFDSPSLFWVYVRALKRFVDKHQLLPLPGTLPDMASDTRNYISLQNLYHDKAVRDLREFAREVDVIVPPELKQAVTEESLRVFCKNAALLYVSQGSKHLHTESLVKTALEGDSLLHIHFALLTFREFVSTHGRTPAPEDFDEFVRLFTEQFAPGLLQLPSGLVDTFKEVLSHSATNYHNTSSLLGGIVGQEVLKIVTAQYIPLDNLLVFDAIKSTSERWKV